MNRTFRRRRRVGRGVNIIAAACVSFVLLAVLGFGYGGIPALGPALDPGEGAWMSAAGGGRARRPSTWPGSTALSRSRSAPTGSPPSRRHRSTTRSSRSATCTRGSGSSQMDDERRLGEGRLAQLGGSIDVASDEFELQLGLVRTARRRNGRRRRSPARSAQALLAYSRGVNDDIAQVRASGQWQATFSLAGVYPSPWTPVDSLHRPGRALPGTGPHLHPAGLRPA